MRKKIFLLILFFTINHFFSQETIIANKELVTTIPVGIENGKVSYFSNEEGFYGPGAPTIDDKGVIWFFSVTNRFILNYHNKLFETIDYPTTYPKEFLVGPNNWPSINQQGIFGFTDYPSNLISQLKTEVALQKIDPQGNKIYPLPNGIAIQFTDYSNHGEVVSIEYKPNVFSMLSPLKREFVSKTRNQTREWLLTQPGGFSIGDDGLLYRNGILWSARKAEGVAGKYIGKLMSGHNVYQSGDRYFRITNSTGAVEVVLEMPWATDSSKKIFQPYNFGLGSWGEFYCLIPPPPVDPTTYYEPKPNLPAELVDVRNHLKYFGRLNDGGVRLRKEPTTAGEILGTFPAKTGFRILEKGTKEETIGGQKNVWYKVRLLDGTEGWFFGSFVHNLYDGPNGNPPPWPNVPDW